MQAARNKPVYLGSEYRSYLVPHRNGFYYKTLTVIIPVNFETVRLHENSARTHKQEIKKTLNY
jgi:hypothetical protein